MSKELKLTDSHIRQLLNKYVQGEFIYSPVLPRLVNELVKAGYLQTSNGKSYGLTQMGRSWCINNHSEYSHIKLSVYK